MYDLGDHMATDEEIKEAKEKGERIVVSDENIELIGYVYKDRIYVDDVLDVLK